MTYHTAEMDPNEWQDVLDKYDLDWIEQDEQGDDE